MAQRLASTTGQSGAGKLASFIAGQQLVAIAGRSFIADENGALFDPSCRSLIIADLLFEKGSALAAKGSFLPPYDTRVTLNRLARVVDYYDPCHVIALGDSLHDCGAAVRIAPEDLSALRDIQTGRIWTWVTGNHDPEVPELFGGACVDEMALGPVVLRHVPGNDLVKDGGELAGHLHPAARLSKRGVGVRRPCFVGDARRLVMPSFGSFTGGLNVRNDAFSGLFEPATRQVWMCGRDGVYPVAWGDLRSD